MTTKPEIKTNDESTSQTTASPPTSQLYPKRKRKSNSQRDLQTVVNIATSTKANRVALLCVGGSLTVVLFARVSGTPGTKSLNDPGDLLKIFIGSGSLAIALMAIGEFAPDLSIHLSILILVGALLTYGVDFATALSKGTLKPGIPLTPLAGQQKGK